MTKEPADFVPSAGTYVETAREFGRRREQEEREKAVREATPMLGQEAYDQATDEAHRDAIDRELDEHTGKYPPAWRPEVGDRLVGRVIRYATVPTNYGKQFVVTIRPDDAIDDGDDDVAVWLSHVVLMNHFARLRPQRGTLVGIRRLDDREGAIGKYRNYHVSTFAGDQTQPPEDLQPEDEPELGVRYDPPPETRDDPEADPLRGWEPGRDVRKG